MEPICKLGLMRSGGAMNLLLLTYDDSQPDAVFVVAEQCSVFGEKSQNRSLLNKDGQLEVSLQVDGIRVDRVWFSLSVCYLFSLSSSGLTT